MGTRRATASVPAMTFATKGDAQRWLSAAETDMGPGDWHDPRLGEVPFRDWADRWLLTKAPTLGPATEDLYRYLLRRHVVPRFGPMAVGRITSADVQLWLAEVDGPSSARTPWRRPTGVSAARWMAPLTPGSSLAHRARSGAPAPSATPR